MKVTLRVAKSRSADTMSLGVPAEIGKVLVANEVRTFEVELTDTGLLYRPVPNDPTESELPAWTRGVKAGSDA